MTVAWELSWYQWEVGADGDGDDGEPVREVAKGDEVSELDEEARAWNAAVGEDGTLRLRSASRRSRSRRLRKLERTRLVVNVDGGARGNPGPAAIAAVVADPDGTVLEERSETIGRATNNVAEYRALLLGIERARRPGRRRGRAGRRLGADRQAGPRRVPGQGRRACASFTPRSGRRSRGFERWSIRHVPREENEHADRLVNEALDAND